MSTNDLPLDEAALNWLHDNHAHDFLGNHPQVIAQARAALTLAARVAELEQRERDSDKAHACQVARVEILLREKAELERELAGERERANDWMARVDSADHEGCAWMAHANALRDALVKFGEHSMSCLADAVTIGPAGRATILERGGDPDAEHQPCTCGYDAALATTPAASLAAHAARRAGKEETK